jgi:hypothetical protein
VASREALDSETLRRRLLLCLYALGTNAGLKRIAAGEHDESYSDLRYVRRRFITREHLREAIALIANATFAARNPQIWGEATTTCASDSKKFGAWDQNLRTEFSQRHFGAGIMVYWHIDKEGGVHLLADQDGLVLRSGRDDRRGVAALHHDECGQEFCRLARPVGGRLCLY